MISIAIATLFVMFLSITTLGVVSGATVPVSFDYDKGTFEITDVSLKSSTYSTEIIGFIKNVDPMLNTIEGVSLTLEIYDKNNHLIGVETAYPVTQNFKPDQKSPFKFSYLDKEDDLDHIYIGILATDWGNAIAPNTPDLSSEINRTSTDCYSDAAKTYYSRSLMTPVRLNMTDPEIKKTITNMCNFYHEKSGLWVNVTNVEKYSNVFREHSQEYLQKYANTYPESLKQSLAYQAQMANNSTTDTNTDNMALYDECVRAAGKSFCDSLFRK